LIGDMQRIILSTAFCQHTLSGYFLLHCSVRWLLSVYALTLLHSSAFAVGLYFDALLHCSVLLHCSIRSLPSVYTLTQLYCSVRYYTVPYVGCWQSILKRAVGDDPPQGTFFFPAVRPNPFIPRCWVLYTQVLGLVYPGIGSSILRNWS